jgi:CheY-like chemotaxis protein
MFNITTKRALVVDDELHNRDFAQKLLERAGFTVVSAANGSTAIAAVADDSSISIALIDHELPDTTGLNLIRTLRAQHPCMMLVMATMHDNNTLIDAAFEAGVDMFIVKPNGFIELFRSLQQPDSKIMKSGQGWVIDQYGPRPYRGAAVRSASLA